MAQLPTSVAFAGLGAMGFGMASHLIRRGYQVIGFDVYEPSLARFAEVGGKTATSPRDAAKEVDFFICMVANAQQADSVLFDEENGALKALPKNACIIICSTVPAAYLGRVQSHLDLMGRSDIFLVDSPVSGGTVRAANGTLTILSSASAAALERANKVLSDMAEKLYVIPGGVGAASNVKMVNQLLAGVHIAAAAEAMGLAAKMGLNTRHVYDIIINAAGNSWMFENRVPHMLDNDWTPKSALDIFVKDMGIVTSSARSQEFPLPLSSAAEQLYIAASSRGYGKEDDSGLVRLFTPQSASAVHDQAKPEISDQKLTPTVTPNEIRKIGFIGLGAMGLGMAISLVNAGFHVCGYDVSAQQMVEFITESEKATAAHSPAEAALDANVLVLMVQNASQVEDVLFGSGKAAENLPNGAVVILNSTVPPSFARGLRSRLMELKKDIDVVDAPVSGGVTKAAAGQLTIIYSASNTAMSQANPVLTAMSGMPKNLYYVEGGVGAASSVKLINQLLAGVHIVAAAEAMAFGAKLGLDTQSLYDIIRNAAGGSWMFENRVPAMLTADWTPHSMLAIFIKDLGIVLEESKRLVYPATLSATAHQLYLMGSSSGWSREADSGIVRIWETMTGRSVAKSAKLIDQAAISKAPQPLPFKPREYPRLHVRETLAALPPPYKGDILATINTQISNPHTPLLIILDDDPTGTQTCHGIAVLTVWDDATLRAEFQSATKGFFILTNSRALPSAEAKDLIRTICQNIELAARATHKEFEIVLRGDSTLRGHFPAEPEAVEETLGRGRGTTDAWILAPFFFQGGRFTIDDVHYVVEGEELVPASQTEFARDASFGYGSSNLRDYVLEKAGGRFKNEDLYSITLEDVRRGGPERVTERLLEVPRGSVVIVNAAVEEDMLVFAAGVLAAEQQGKKYLYRTGAAFVSSRLGIRPIPPLSFQDLHMSTTTTTTTTTTGGLIIAGSYVPKTTTQLKSLISRRGPKLHVIELPVSQLLASAPSASTTIAAAASAANTHLLAGTDVLIMTSRKLITGADALSSLNIGSVVAATLVRIVQDIRVRPRYVIAKGGITSSDIATKALGMRRAVVLGQAAPGVPLWKCEESTSRHRGVPYVVFPGNVGGEEALAELVERWAGPGGRGGGEGEAEVGVGAGGE